MQYVAASVESVAHRHKLVYVWETLIVFIIVYRYTRLTSCDIWGTKEVDFLGLDDFSSPYQDEEVIGRTPTLAQLNGEDSQPVCDTLYHPELPLSKKTPGPTRHAPTHGPTLAPSFAPPTRSPLPDFPDGFQKATCPVPSSTETRSKAQIQGSSTKMFPLALNSSDFVRKAKVRISTLRGPHAEAPPMKTTERKIGRAHV